MDIKKIKQKVLQLENKCQSFVSDVQEIDDFTSEEISLKIKVFNSLVQECKEEVDSSDKEHMAHVLQLLFNIKIPYQSSDELYASLEKFSNDNLNNTNIDTSEEEIKNLGHIIFLISEVHDIVQIEYTTLSKNERRNLFTRKSKLSELETILERLSALKLKVEKQIEIDSKKLAIHIIDNFYNMYIYFSFLIKMLLMEKEHIMLIEITSCLDRYINVIKPAFNKRKLQHNDMIYYYAIFELNYLKQKINKVL